MNVWQRLLRKFRVNEPRNRVLRVERNAVVLYDAHLDEQLWRVQWTDVEEIVAFKVDAYVVDHVCLGFRVGGSDVMKIAVEETVGWSELNDELWRTFNIHLDEWFTATAFSAFSENDAVLWRRGAA